MNMNTANHSEPKLGKTLIDDFRWGDLRPTVSRDWRDLKDFFLTAERRKRLAEMGWFKRWFFMILWLLKSLFLKLTPVRRILAVIGLLFLLSSGSLTVGGENFHIGGNTSMIGAIIIIFILMLELKDKLVAKSELEAGRAVQDALLAHKKPKIDGWDLCLITRPANDVGGDLVDYIPLGKNKYGVVLADVAGKGLGAALLMAKLQATLRALAKDFKSLVQLARKINEIFYSDTLANSFASLVYLELVANSGNVRLINAGHIPPVIVRGNEIEELPKGTPALGLAYKTDYTEKSIQLSAGEVMIIYSDGLSEARNEQGNFFGDQKLMALLREVHTLTADEVCQHLINKIDHFLGNAAQNDDLSLVVVKKID
jgi:sigma-B regulation protein RsbU (phosphoserine phosphatase)